MSEVTKRQYIRRLEMLAEIGGHADPWTAISHHKATIAALEARYRDKPASLHIFSTVVLSSYKYVPRLKTVAPASFAAWTRVSEDAKIPLEHHALSAQPTARQAHGWVPFPEIVEMRESLPVGSDARLLISMYTLIPSVRNDLSNMTIYTSTPPVGTGGNYLVLPSRGTARMVITEFKTSKSYQAIKQDLPASLVAEIRASLSLNPRKLLFVTMRGQLPYNSENAFSSWANRLLKRTFGKPLTLTLMRHSYVSSLDFNNMTPLERMDIARKMGHSVTAQMQYRFIFKG